MEFFYLNIKDTVIKLHDFHPSSIVGVSKYLKDSWNKNFKFPYPCLQN